MPEISQMMGIVAGLNTALLVWLIKGQSALSNRVSNIEGKLSPYTFAITHAQRNGESNVGS